MQIKFISSPPAKRRSLFQKIVALVAAVALAVVVLMFSAVLLAVILVVGAIGFAWLWWKTRAMRTQLREMQEFARNAQTEVTRSEVFEGEVYEGEIIECEAVRVVETDIRIER